MSPWPVLMDNDHSPALSISLWLERARPGLVVDTLRHLTSTPPSEGCKLWPHARNQDGYGYFNYRTPDGLLATTTAHRGVLLLAVGDPPEGMPGAEAAHDPEHCTDRACINRTHLRWATPAENLADTLRAGTRVPKPTTGRVYGLADYPTQEMVAAEAGVSQATVSRYLAGKAPRLGYVHRMAIDEAVADLGYVRNLALGRPVVVVAS